MKIDLNDPADLRFVVEKIKWYWSDAIANNEQCLNFSRRELFHDGDKFLFDYLIAEQVFQYDFKRRCWYLNHDSPWGQVIIALIWL